MSEALMRELIEEVKKLHDTIAIMQQDINCIRNGEYDKPQGAAPQTSRQKRPPTSRLQTNMPDSLGVTSRDW